ncbi:MAG: hypothetical protein ABI565_08090 [Vicinamibacteria bacterium]
MVQVAQDALHPVADIRSGDTDLAVLVLENPRGAVLDDDVAPGLIGKKRILLAAEGVRDPPPVGRVGIRLGDLTIDQGLARTIRRNPKHSMHHRALIGAGIERPVDHIHAALTASSWVSLT